MAPIKRKHEVAEQIERPGKKFRVSLDKPSLPLKEAAPFPRGGASVLTPLEQKQIKIQAKQDVLFEQTTGQTIPKSSIEYGSDSGSRHEETDIQTTSKPKKGKAVSSKKRSVAQVVQEKPVRVESLSYKVRHSSILRESID